MTFCTLCTAFHRPCCGNIPRRRKRKIEEFRDWYMGAPEVFEAA